MGLVWVLAGDRHARGGRTVRSGPLRDHVEIRRFRILASQRGLGITGGANALNGAGQDRSDHHVGLL